MPEMVERVARAIWDARRAGSLNPAGKHLTWDEITEPEKHGVNPFGLAPLALAVRNEARSAIAAMRDPTEAMVKAGNAITVYGDDMAGELGYVGDSGEVYQAMIDEALCD